jgi:type IV secretion system protein TrbL
MAGCGTLDISCKAGSIVTGALGDALDRLAKAVAEAVGKVVAALGTVWLHVGTPQLTTTDGGSAPSDAVGFIQGSLWWYAAAAAVLAVVVGGARMAWERRAQPGQELLRGLLTMVVVFGAGLTAISLLVTASDQFAGWIVDRSTQGTDFGQNITAMLNLSSAAGSSLGPLLVVIFGLLALLASAVQIMLMVVRGGMLVILAGILPLAASFTSTEMGRTWFRKCVSWTIAFTLYKPAAAIVYATAFRLTGSRVQGLGDGQGLVNVLTGLVLMIVALFALPALMRFVTPLVGSVASGGGAGAGALAGGVVAALPTGAISLGGGAGATPRIPRQGSSSAPTGASGDGPAGSGPVPNGSQGPSGSPGSSGTGGESRTPAGSSRGGAGGQSPGSGGSGLGGGSGSAGPPAASSAGGAGTGAAGANGAAAAGAAGAVASGAQAALGAVKGAAQGGAEHGTSTPDEKDGPRGSA